MTDQTYNGWTNYETWIIHLWFNDPADYEHAREIAKAAPSDLAAGETMRDQLLEDAYDRVSETGLLTDLLTHAIQRADWRAIGAAFRED